MEIDSESVDIEEELLGENTNSDNSENDEENLEMKIKNIENKIQENPFAYQPYLDLINALKSLADLERLRDARKKMANQFPLAPNLWIDWLQDEINIATTLKEKEKIIEIFQAAVKDYLCVEIWLKYVTFFACIESEKDPSNFLAVRNIFEEAIMAAGLHVTKGSLLWKSYIEYEKNLLNSLKEKPEDYENELKYIANLYKRQLSCPLWDIEESYDEFKKWIEKHEKNVCQPIIDKQIVTNIYLTTKKKLDKIKPFEELLLSESENLEFYRKYLEHEKSKEGSPVRVQCLYERALCDNCLNEELWLEYVEYVNAVLGNSDMVFKICKRAIRNCPWYCKLYQTYIICLERYEQPQKIIIKIVEDAFASGLQIASDFRDIWMTYLEYLRRRFDSSGISKEEEDKRLEDLRTAFTKATEFVFQLQDADPEYSIVQFWARIEAIYCKNMDKSRELWNLILSDEKNQTADMWLEYIHLERAFGDSKHLRKLFPRALQFVKDYPDNVGKVWLNYERDEGTLESYENCIQKIRTKTKQMLEKQEKEALVLKSKIFSEYYNKSKKPFKKKEKIEEQISLTENKNPEILGTKRKHSDWNNEANSLKKSKEFYDSDKKVENNDEFVEKLLEESKFAHGETVIHDSSKDNRTVFVSNLDFTTEEPVIREIFSHCGQISDLRLVKDYKGRSKGFCYVEFEKTKEAQSALKKDRELIKGRPMFVSKCDPDKETRTSGFKYSVNMEKNKLFVRGLPFATTEKDLRQLFSKFGILKGIRIVTYRNGHSKGLAYIEYQNESSAAEAVLETDGMTIENKQISVAISNPPGRKIEKMHSESLVSSLGGGSKEIGPRGKGRTQISFLPRSVTLNKCNKTAESLAGLSIASPLPTENEKQLNNSDFRKLLG